MEDKVCSTPRVRLGRAVQSPVRCQCNTPPLQEASGLVVGPSRWNMARASSSIHQTLDENDRGKF